MKKTLLYGAMALMAAGAVSCSDDAASVIDNTEGLTYGVAYGSFEDPDSRTVRPETGSGADVALGFNWENGDKIALIDLDKNNRTLAILTYNNNGFEGGIRLGGRTSVNVAVAYLGRGVEINAANDWTQYGITLTEQLGTLGNLPAYDVMTTGAAGNNPTLTVEDNQYNLLFSVRSVLAFAHYKVTFPEGVNYDGSDITVHGMNSAATANLTDGANNLQNISADDITLKGLSATNTNSVDVYLAVVPGTEQSVGFSVTIGGVTYSTTRTAMDFVRNIYYHSASGQGANTPVVNTEERNITYTLPHTSSTGTWSWKKIVADNTPVTVGSFEGRSDFDTAMAGWRLDGWKHNDGAETIADNTASYTLSAGIHTFTAVIYKAIIYDANGGKFSNGEGTATKEFDKITPNIRPYYEKPTREGYTFVGWKDSQNKIYTNLVESSEYGKENFPDVTTTLTAQWEEVKSSFGVNAGNLPASNPWSNN